MKRNPKITNGMMNWDQMIDVIRTNYTKYNFKSHNEIPPETAADMLYKFNASKITDISLADINGYLNEYEGWRDEVYKN
jgi:hypothetical protein